MIPPDEGENDALPMHMPVQRPATTSPAQLTWNPPEALDPLEAWDWKLHDLARLDLD